MAQEDPIPARNESSSHPAPSPGTSHSPAEGVGRVGRQAPADPTLVSYGLICSPALAEIVGDGSPWTVLMISLLSMPWR